MTSASRREADAIAALRVSGAWQALGNERFEADGGIFIRNRNAPGIRDANHVTEITASTPYEIDRLLDRTEREFAGYEHLRFDVDFTTPPEFEARLTLEGYSRGEELVMLLDGELAGEAGPHDIRLVDDAVGEESLDVLREHNRKEWRTRVGDGSGDDITSQWDLLKRAKSPPVRYWMAYLDGEPAAYLASWGGVGGIGQV